MNWNPSSLPNRQKGFLNSDCFSENQASGHFNSRLSIDLNSVDLNDNSEKAQDLNYNDFFLPSNIPHIPVDKKLSFELTTGKLQKFESLPKSKMGKRMESRLENFCIQNSKKKPFVEKFSFGKFNETVYSSNPFRKDEHSMKNILNHESSNLKQIQNQLINESWQSDSVYGVQPRIQRKKSCDLKIYSSKIAKTKLFKSKRVFKKDKFILSKNYKLKKKSKTKFRKVFEPKNLFNKIEMPMLSNDFKEKLSMFLFLPYFINMNHKNGSKNTSIPSNEKSKNLLSTPLKSLKQTCDIKTNLSNDLSVTDQTIRLTEDQKTQKIAKKLRRAWNLNQQIPVNVFKKQVQHFETNAHQSVHKEFNTELTTVPLKRSAENFDFEPYFGIKNKRSKLLQRKSKVLARNKIKSFMLQQKKKRTPVSQGKEYEEYRQLIGLKRDTDQTQLKENLFIEKLTLPDSNDQGKQHRSFLSPMSEEQPKDFVEQRFCQLLSSKMFHPTSVGCTVPFTANRVNLEFLDFSFKNINKTKFFGN